MNRRLQQQVRLLLLCLALPVTVAGQGLPDGIQGYREGIAPFFAAHCVRCHGPERSKGSLTLHTLEGDLTLGRDLERWERVLEVLRDGEMPPEGQSQPEDARRQEMADWIETGLRAYVASAGSAAHAPTTRRLTNNEYRNTMRDLLGFELDALLANLPADPTRPYEFRNTAEFMLLGMEQLDRYMENGRRAMASAIVDPEPPEVHRHARRFDPLDPAQRGLQLDEIGVYGNRRHSVAWGFGLKSWPETGEYRIRMEAAAILPDGFDEVPLRVVMGQDLNVNSSSRQIAPVGTALLRNGVDNPRILEFRGRIENHPSLISYHRGKRRHALTITPQNLHDDGQLNDRVDPLAMPRVVVQSIEFEAPVTDVWPPAHHTRILFDSPLRASDPDAYARAVLERFMTRAFRRPVRADELDRFARIHAILSTELDTFEAAMRETLAMVLASPQFLLHTTSDGKDPTHRAFETASRLSYFLWGSMPDEALLERAARNELDDPVVIEAEVLRLLADPRARDFIADFTTQWLSIEKARAVKINASLFPRFLYLVPVGERRGTEVPYRPTVRDVMQEETIGFIAELIRRNDNVLKIVDSDFAMLNERLAAHYGVDGVKGHTLRPVPVEPAHHLGGLLTQGSVLVGNSTGSAPHPIYRAVWLREAILGEDVRPPPAEVPALVDSAGDAAEKAVAIKDLLRLHRQSSSCAECHVRLDPWGIPFERYDATGRYRPRVPAEGTRVRGLDRRNGETPAAYEAYREGLRTVPADATARVPHGPEVDGLGALKRHLIRRRGDDITRNVLERLLSYGLGRKLSYRDRFTIDRLHEVSESNEHRLRDMIVAICQSATFRGAPETTPR